MQKLNIPIFHVLLESGTGFVHAVNARVDHALVSRRGRGLNRRARLGLAGALLIFSIFMATRFGLVKLIAKGYRALAYVFLAIYVLPLLTLGAARLIRGHRGEDPTAVAPNVPVVGA